MFRYRMTLAIVAIALGLLVSACTATSRSDDDDVAAADPTATPEMVDDATDDEDSAMTEPDDADTEGESDDHADDHDHVDDHAHDDDHGDDHAHDDQDDSGVVEVSEPATRLMISDGDAGEVTVLDAATGEVLATFEVEDPDGAPNMFATSENGRFGFVIMYGQDAVEVIDGGVWEVDHSDHAHYYEAPPESLARYEGGRPAHVVSHGDRTAIFFDDDGTYLLIDRETITEGADGTLIETDAPHHGVAVPWDDERTIVSVFEDLDPAETTLPSNVVVHDLDGEIIESGFPECPDLHGEVTLGDVAAFACSDGILLLEAHGNHFHGAKIDYPDDEGRSGTIRTASGMDVIVGNYSAEAYVVIDPEAETIDLIEIPEPFSAFAVSSHAGGTLIGISASGYLHTVEISTGTVTTIEGVVEAYDENAQWTEPTPQLTAGANGVIYVSEPATGEVHVIDLEAGEVANTYDVPGAPFHITFIGSK